MISLSSFFYKIRNKKHSNGEINTGSSFNASKFFPISPSKNIDPIGVILVNLGTPESPTRKGIRKYLSQFLSDPRVIEIPRFIWIPVLYGFVLLSRPRKLESRYQRIWMKDGSPLAVYSQRQVTELTKLFSAKNLNIRVEQAMRYGKPCIAESLKKLINSECNRILIFPMYPQYSSSTTASVSDEVNRYLKNLRNQPNMRFVKRFNTSEYYIQPIIHQIKEFWIKKQFRPQVLVLSFHGLPQSSVVLGDPYYHDCLETASLIQKSLNLSDKELKISFQSRFGFNAWLKPSTDFILKKLASEGVQSVDVMCPGFVCDCLETLEEIEQESKVMFLKCGGKHFRYIPALNDHSSWIKGLYSLVLHHIQNW